MGRKGRVNVVPKKSTIGVKDCNMKTENWVIVCATEIIPSDAHRCIEVCLRDQAEAYIGKNADTMPPTPWSRYSRWKHREKKRRIQAALESQHIPVDYHKKEDSTTISRPVGGLYAAPVSPGERTNFAINLQEAAVRMRHLGAQYNPASIHALMLKFRHPSAAILVFSAGRMVCTGARTQARAIYLLNLAIDMLRHHGYPGLRMKPNSWAIVNVVASARVPAKINVRRLYEANRQYCTYDPDIFPGVPFKKKNQVVNNSGVTVRSKTTILVFDSGSLVITGAKDEDELRDALEECLPDIWAARVRTRRRR